MPTTAGFTPFGAPVPNRDATIVARLIAQGAFREPGVHPPEFLGARPGLADVVLGELGRRGVTIRHDRQILES